MQCKKRYFLTGLVSGVVFLLYYASSLFFPALSVLYGTKEPRVDFIQFANDEDLFEKDTHVSVVLRRSARSVKYNFASCRMDTCFDYERCSKHGFRVYVYPSEEATTSTYEQILSVIRASRYYTDDPNTACIFILSLDTLDRDVLSPNYVRGMQQRIDALEHWNNGQNHLIFNTYSGTWPAYDESDYGFRLGKALLAKASLSESRHRPGFDISFPLFHKQHAFRGGASGTLVVNNVPPVRNKTLVFKGKRYVTGMGSETRNALYHIHNDKDIVLLTTCKHGKDWKQAMDERCAKDNKLYDSFDYRSLMMNSTFCLVPRGRRLGSYRFLEALQAGCVPVLLSNGYVLPFDEVIDWGRAVVWADERLLLQVPTLVRSLSHARVLNLRQQTQFLWNTYFASIDTIVSTTLEIIRRRLSTHAPHLPQSVVWNCAPGGLVTHPEYSPLLSRFPFFSSQIAFVRFTALIYVTHDHSALPTSSLARLIVILWHCDCPLPRDVRWNLHIRVNIRFKVIDRLSERFSPHSEIETDAVLSLDHDTIITADEVNFGLRVFSHFPDRIVGFPARSHYWDDVMSEWRYSSRDTNQYSCVLTGDAFFHRMDLRRKVDLVVSCDDLLMNMLVSHVTQRPPIKLTQRRLQTRAMTPYNGSLKVAGARFRFENLRKRHGCLNTFARHFGYMPLKKSSLRLDPLLFKDKVARSRKKYPVIDTIT